jgi:hypothetical protein
MEIVNILRDYAWPLVVLIIALCFIFFRMENKNVLIKFLGNEINITPKEAGEQLSMLFSEFYKEYGFLKDNEKQLFRLILDRQGTPKVQELLPGFTRENEIHLGTLRALRGLGLIKPVNGGKWRPEKEVTLTNFGKLVGNYLKDKNLI